MDTNLNVAIAPKDSTFQVRINSEIKRAVEDIYAKTGMTLTDAFNRIQLCEELKACRNFNYCIYKSSTQS